jgi:protease I
MNKNPYISNSILLFLAAHDFNEQEYLIISTTLERAGIKVFIVSDSNSVAIGNNKLKVKNDVQLCNANQNNFSGFILVGGNGVTQYLENNSLQSLIRKFAENQKTIGAICISPIILAKAGVLTGSATCYRENKNSLENEGIRYEDIPVVVHNKIITAQDPAAASEFVKAFLYELFKT